MTKTFLLYDKYLYQYKLNYEHKIVVCYRRRKIRCSRSYYCDFIHKVTQCVIYYIKYISGYRDAIGVPHNFSSDIVIII